MNQTRTVSTAPQDFLRRSPLYRWHVEAGADFEELAGAAVVSAYGDPASQAVQAEKLGLADLSPLARTGLKGRGAAAWIESQGIEVPAASNTSRTLRSGALCARLSPQEILLLGDLHGQAGLIPAVESALLPGTAVATWLLPRADSHCWFALSGHHAAEALSKLCAVDLRAHKFSATDIAQTSLARSNAIIIRHDLGSTHGFYLLADLSLAQYLWQVLRDAMLEFEGDAIGIKALRQLATER